MLSFSPRDVLDEILNLLESVAEGFSTYFCMEILTIYLRNLYVKHKVICFLLYCTTHTRNINVAMYILS